MAQNYIYLQPTNQYQNIFPTSNSSYESYGTSDYQLISGQKVITLPPISYQEMQKQQNYLNTNQNVTYNIPQSNIVHGHQNLVVENYQQNYPQYTTQPQVKILQPQPIKNQQTKNVVPAQNYYQLTQPQTIQYQQKNIQQNPQVPIPRAKVEPIIQQQVPIQKAKVQQIGQPQVPTQQEKVQQIIQPKTNVQGQPIYQNNIVENKVPQMDINLQNIQDKPFFVPAFEPNLQLANLILKEPQIPLEIITTQSPEEQNSGQNPQAHSENSPNPQQVKQQNNKKIVMPVRNPNTNIKQYEQSSDTHFVNTNEAAKVKTNTAELKGNEDNALNENDRPTVGEGHGLFTSTLLNDNFDDNLQEVNKNKIKGRNPGNNNVKSINPKEAKNIVNNQTSNIIPGKENLNAQKPIENNNINLTYGNNGSPQNQSVIENFF